jgi:hypothetical protein
MEFLEANWLWILLLGLGVAWFLVRRGGTGHGPSGYGSHGSSTRSDVREGTHGSHGRHGTRESRELTDPEPAGPRQRHGGCC